MNIKRVSFSVLTFSETLVILRREIQPQIYLGLHAQYTLFLHDFNKTCIFSTDFGEIFKYKIAWKSVQWEPSFSMLTDGRAGRHK